ncbi:MULTISPECIES: RHS repeat-associated core domain-containing protein, partial [unclassified Curtobacterium]|uniref:RHS repeat-associated core domain-containing protein n=1 Tax=unclassified Curtobacterium TaxID=257496 RepID=UPI0038185C71
WQQNPYGYKTGIHSSNSDTRLTKFGYRWQSATTGQWLERDTLDAPLDPNNANRYAFVGCDPINGADPTGMGCGWDWTLEAIAFAGLAVAVFSGPAGWLAVAGLGFGLAGSGLGTIPLFLDGCV